MILSVNVDIELLLRILLGTALGAAIGLELRSARPPCRRAHARHRRARLGDVHGRLDAVRLLPALRRRRSGGGRRLPDRGLRRLGHRVPGRGRDPPHRHHHPRADDGRRLVARLGDRHGGRRRDVRDRDLRDRDRARRPHPPAQARGSRRDGRTPAPHSPPRRGRHAPLGDRRGALSLPVGAKVSEQEYELRRDEGVRVTFDVRTAAPVESHILAHALERADGIRQLKVERL